MVTFSDGRQQPGWLELHVTRPAGRAGKAEGHFTPDAPDHTTPTDIGALVRFTLDHLWGEATLTHGSSAGWSFTVQGAVHGL